ncbi:MAG: sulfatase-like hydrolase/transferase [Lachnospiraceae bacterium]|nr:sulfatase-like hydrolase/transferase [Lachnospiraceae bacterium]
MKEQSSNAEVVTETNKESFKQRIKRDARNCFKDIHKKDILLLIVCALCVNFVVETLALIKYDGILGALMKLLPDFSKVSSNGSEAFAGFMGIFTHPLKVLNDPIIFLYNSCIVMVLLSFALLFKRRYFAMTILSGVWIGFGIANFVILSYRVTPFSAVELKLIDAAVGVMKSYVTRTVFVIVMAVILLAVAAVVFVWLKTPKLNKINRFSSMILIAGTFVLVFLATFMGLKTGVVASKLPNLSVNYQEYGFVYCFVSSFKTGIGKPNDYSEAKVKEIQTHTKQKLTGVTDTALDTEPTSTPTPVSAEAVVPVDDASLPNVLFLQLESFFDITALDQLELSEDPIPTFRKYMEEFSSGYLSVPSVGAGTANTEFEVMTGMNLDFFGPGEYPYKTVLTDKSCETTGYNLKNHGYTTQAIHNNRATFYGRNSVFRRFGYDVFTTIELMNIEEYTQNGWAKDKVLTGEIMKALKSTEGKDYIYTISVQGHGDYPETAPIEKPEITITNGITDEAEKNKIEYYVNQIHEMDQFLKELTDALTEFGEDTVLVVYGDHLPNLGITEEQLTRGDMFQTQYFVWNNIGLEVRKEDIDAYQLSAKVLNSIHVTDGIINAYHQANWEKRGTDQYLKELEILSYDMLYGDKTATGGVNVYEPTKLKYGVDNVEVTSAYRDQSDTDYLIIKGNYFTNYSAVFINEEKLIPEFVDVNTLRLHLPKQIEDIKIVVKQSYKGKLVLQTSNEILYASANEVDVYNDGDGNDNPENEGEDDLPGLLEEESAIIGEEQIDNEQEKKE